MAFLNKVPIKDILSNQNEIKVALRHHYKFEDVVMWNDSMNLAKHFGIETRNPFYCAPKNIEVLHNSLLKKKLKEDAEKEKETLVKYEAAYYNHIEPFLEMVLKGTNVVIVPLKSVMEVYMEGRMMSDKDVLAIAALPSKDALRAQLLGLLNAVPTGLVRVLNAKVTSIVNVINAYKNKLDETQN